MSRTDRFRRDRAHMVDPEPGKMIVFETPLYKPVSEWWFPKWRTAEAIISDAMQPLRYVSNAPNRLGIDFAWLESVIDLCPPEDRGAFRAYHRECLSKIDTALSPLDAAVLQDVKWHPNTQITLALANNILAEITHNCEVYRKPTPTDVVRRILGLTHRWERLF